MDAMTNAAKNYVASKYDSAARNEFDRVLLLHNHLLGGNAAEIYDGMYFLNGTKLLSATKKLARELAA